MWYWYVVLQWGTAAASNEYKMPCAETAARLITKGCIAATAVLMQLLQGSYSRLL